MWNNDVAFADPVDAKGDPANKMVYFAPEGVHVDLHNPDIIRDSLAPDASPETRQAALNELTVLLTDDLITGGTFKQPTSNDKTVFVRVPDNAVEALRKYDADAMEVMFARHAEWLKLSQPLSRERFTTLDKDIRVWKSLIEPPKDADKDGWTMTLATYADDENLTLLRQKSPGSKEFSTKIKDSATGQLRKLKLSDFGKGARVVCSVFIGGLRCKKNSMSVMRPIVKTLWLMCGGQKAPPKSHMANDIQINDDDDDNEEEATTSGVTNFANDVDAAIAKSHAELSAADAKEE